MTKGKDFVCGDIHGWFSVLDAKLEELNFNYDTDRLFVVGDLIDRGMESDRVLEYLDQPWFFSLAGNHELLMCCSLYEVILPYASRYWMPIWLNNGGIWATFLDDDKKSEIAKVLSHLPLAMEIETDRGLVGLTHAEFRGHQYTWDHVKQVLLDVPDRKVEFQGGTEEAEIAEMLVWSRVKVSNPTYPAYQQPVEGIEHIFHGHTVLDDPITIGNCTYLDTGVYDTGILTVVQIDEWLDQLSESTS